MKSRQFLELISFQFITVTEEVLDQYSIVDRDLVFEMHNFHWIRSVVSYSLFWIIRGDFLDFDLIWLLLFMN